jgi:hypothetical protein
METLVIEMYSSGASLLEIGNTTGLSHPEIIAILNKLENGKI